MVKKKTKYFLVLVILSLIVILLKEYRYKFEKINKVNVLSGKITDENMDYLEFLNRYMMKDGGVSTEVSIKDSIQRNNIVLSESQGLVMEIATYLRDESLFKNSYGYLKKNMKLFNSLYSWRKDKEKISSSTATIDDLRIYRGLVNANSLWGGYEKDIFNMEENLKKVVVNNCFVDFLEKGKKGDEFSLFYIDGEALNYLSKRDEKFKKVKENIEQVLEKAKINDNTPFYKEVYLVNEGKFKFQENADTLNTILILYNRKKLGQDITREYEQLKSIFLRDGALYSKYNFQGIPISNVESSSIYGYFYILSSLQNDKENIEKVKNRIDLLIGKEKNFNGLLIPISNREKVYSFDLLILLLASVRRMG